MSLRELSHRHLLQLELFQLKVGVKQHPSLLAQPNTLDLILQHVALFLQVAFLQVELSLQTRVFRYVLSSCFDVTPSGSHPRWYRLVRLHVVLLPAMHLQLLLADLNLVVQIQVGQL
jgi:hypothetical protein